MQPLPTVRDVQEALGAAFREHGGLGAIVIDLVFLERIERGFGGATHEAVRQQLQPVIADLGRDVRTGDVLARDERQPDRFILFLTDQRPEGRPDRFSVQGLQALADRIEGMLAPRVARLTQAFLREGLPLEIGYGYVLHSPYESDERQVVRLIEDAQATADLRKRLRERRERETLVEIIRSRQVWTVFQSILEIESRDVVGYEALSRGPRGTPLQPPNVLFAHAARQGLTEELERACRRQAFRDWELFGGSKRLFLNTVPATIRDTSFIGRGLLDYLGPSLSPSHITLEITERQIIENLALFREAMHSFLDLGFTFAIDDVGAGYSGLETISRLGAAYLKIDLSLVRGIHEKSVNKQIVKAILEMGHGVGATVIAEGIETEDEAQALLDLGVRYGQGYLYGRPQDPRTHNKTVVGKIEPTPGR